MPDHLIQVFEYINQLLDSHPENTPRKNHISITISEFLREAKAIRKTYEEIPLTIWDGDEQARIEDIERAIGCLLSELTRKIAYTEREFCAEGSI